MKDLYFFLAHIDDFEISCIGYLFRNHKHYNNIYIIIATDWEPKREIWLENLDLICSNLNISQKVKYINLGYEPRLLMTNIDNLKNDFYEQVDFNLKFDIVTHDKEDCHTDHIACSLAGTGLYKYTNKYVTIYSPSSKHFKANYWIGLPQEIYNIKKACIDKYDIRHDKSYTKLGYYIQSEKHYNKSLSITKLIIFIN